MVMTYNLHVRVICASTYYLLTYLLMNARISGSLYSMVLDDASCFG